MRLARHEQFVGAKGPVTWPDGTVASGFRFHHALYQETLYGRLPAGHRIELHRRIAQEKKVRLVNAQERSRQNWRIITVGPTRGRRRSSSFKSPVNEHSRGARWSRPKATTAVRWNCCSNSPKLRSAIVANSHFDVVLGPALIAVKGWAAPEVEHTYSRALELCPHSGEPSHRFSALFGLQALYAHRPKLLAALEIAEQGLDLAQKAGNLSLLLEAYHILGYNLLYLGELKLSLGLFGEGNRSLQSEYHALAFTYGEMIQESVVCVITPSPLVSWLSRPRSKKCARGLRLARSLRHPLSLALL